MRTCPRTHLPAPRLQYVTRPFVTGDQVALVNSEGVEVEVRAAPPSGRHPQGAGAGARAGAAAAPPWADLASPRPLPGPRPQGVVLNIEPTRTILQDVKSGCIVHVNNAEVGGGAGVGGRQGVDVPTSHASHACSPSHLPVPSCLILRTPLCRSHAPHFKVAEFIIKNYTQCRNLRRLQELQVHRACRERPASCLLASLPAPVHTRPAAALFALAGGAGRRLWSGAHSCAADAGDAGFGGV